MESLSEPMKITISESTFNLIKDKFSYTEKAEVNVKGKGSMKTYFIE
jgi:class 3 adenylate cyclase